MAVRETARQQEAGQKLSDQEMDGLLEQIAAKYGADPKEISIGSLLAGEKNRRWFFQRTGGQQPESD